MVSRTQDKDELRIPKGWERQKKLNERTDRIIKPIPRRCALCFGYDFSYPINIIICSRCLNKTAEVMSEVNMNFSQTITIKPCFYCGRRETFMFRLNTYACHNCIKKISRVVNEKVKR